jgi:hypothetical protein
MIRFVTICLVVTAIGGALVFQFRGAPAVGKFLLNSTDAEEMPFAWPPKLGSQYPDLTLVDHTGATRRLSEFRGKIILIELVGIPCGACQAYAGAHEVGAFGGEKVQANLESIERYARRFGGFNLNDPRVVFVQLLLFNSNLDAPSPAEGRAWAEHFRTDRYRNRVVLVGTSSLATKDSYDMIPGFQLIDRDFTLVRDSCGHQPTHNLYTDLLPTMGKLVTSRNAQKAK